MNIGYIGLGKMGSGMVARLTEHGHTVTSYDPSGTGTVQDLTGLVSSLPTPRTIWIMVPSGAVDTVLHDLTPLLTPNDTIIDGGNSHYTDTVRRSDELTRVGIHFLDVGVSGGPNGARSGACLMIGGERADYDLLESLWKDLSVEQGFAYVGGHGAGHFVKMVHNGIEYGMMQAIAEGFAVMKASPYDLNLTSIANIYNRGSVIESHLIKWLHEGFEQYGENLSDITGVVAHTGEGEWTIEAARAVNVPVPIIEGSLQFRKDSEGHPSYTGKVLSLLRAMFGGHNARTNG